VNRRGDGAMALGVPTMSRSLASVALLLIAGPVAAANPRGPVSGLQVGERAASGFSVRTVTGPKRGTTLCYPCRYGDAPTVCIVARELSPPLVELIARVEAHIDREPRWKGFVVFLTDDDLTNRLQSLARERRLEHIPLTTLSPSDSPPNYKLAKDAGVTVMIWSDFEVRANHASHRLEPADVEVVLADLSRVLDP
jgi:hypothetical protein